MEFNLIDLCLLVTTDDKPAFLQWVYRAGAEFSSVCRHAVCRWPEGDCHVCCESDDCQWYQVFSQELTVDPNALKSHQKPPLPFAFSFGGSPLQPENPEEITVRFIVIGRAISCLDMLLAGFASLIEGQRDLKCELGKVYSCDYQGTPHLIGEKNGIQPQNLVVLSASGIIESRPWGCDKLGLVCTAPLRIIQQGHVLRNFDASVFVRSLLRRVSAMAYYYGECSPVDFKELSRQAEQIVCSKNEFRFFPMWMGTNKLAGLIGNCMLSGRFHDLLPFLILGSYIHTGKGAAFGLGNYVLYTDQ